MLYAIVVKNGSQKWINKFDEAGRLISITTSEKILKEIEYLKNSGTKIYLHLLDSNNHLHSTKILKCGKIINKCCYVEFACTEQKEEKLLKPQIRTGISAYDFTINEEKQIVEISNMHRA